MNKIFTSCLAMLLLATSNKTFSQCLTGGTFTAATTNSFSTTSEGYSGDFAWTSAGAGQLESTPVSSGATKKLTTALFSLPASETTIAWSYDLGGNANVTGYTVEAQYNAGAGVNTVAVCSGGALATTGGNLKFAALAPSEIIGTSFRLVITFTSSSTGNKTLILDNFSTNANAFSVLPVSFSYFNTSAASGGVLLTWMVSSEINVNRYEVERSSNGKSFSKIGSVSANASSSYNFTDAAPLTGSNYYRLKAVDNDGKFKYSTVVLYKTGRKTTAMRAFPMPATNAVTIEHNTINFSSLFSILSQDGKLIKTFVPSPGTKQTVVDLSTFKTGLYLLHFNNANGEMETMKLIKQ